VAQSQGAIVDPEYAGIIGGIVPPALRAVAIELRELGPSYRGENPGRGRSLASDHPRVRRPRRPRASPVSSRWTWRCWRPLRVPTLVLASDADLLAPPLADRFAGGRASSQ